MKIAEALQERAALAKKIDRISVRLNSNALVQEGEKPQEDPAMLMNELNESVAQLEKLISDVNLANCKTIVNGKSLTEHIAHKDCLVKKISVLQSLEQNSNNLARRASHSEIKIFATIDASDLQKQIDSLSKELRLTDNLIQETNWKTEI